MHKNTKGRPPLLVVTVDEIDGTEWRTSGRRIDDVETHGDCVTYCGRTYSPDRKGFPNQEGTYHFSPDPVESQKPGRLMLRVCSDGHHLWTEGGRVIGYPVEMDGENAVRHAGGIYAIEGSGYPAPGLYGFQRIREAPEPVRREPGVDASQWWEETKKRMYSPEMCEAYRDAALLARAAGRELHPDYWKGVPEEYRV